MKHIFYICCCFLICVGCSIFGIHPNIHNPHRAGKYPKRTEAIQLLGGLREARNCYNVVHYDLSIDFGSQVDKVGKTISGTVIMTALTLQTTDSIQLDLHTNMKINELQYAIESAEQIDNGDAAKWQTASYKRTANAVFIALQPALATGQRFKIRINYSGTPPEAKRPPWRGGFVRAYDQQKRPWLGVACQSEGASLWWPCKDVMNDEPESVDVHLRVPTGLTAVSNGHFVDTSNIDQTTLWNWKIANPVNIYDVTFYIGKLKLLHDTYTSKVTGQTLDLNHYVLDYNFQKARSHFKQVINHIKFYEETFGAYPWYMDGFKLVESPYAGMEHQSAIAYGNGYKNDYFGSIDYIILHETAHEWWGNSLTASDLAHAWLHEGFASYCEALYVEKTQGHAAYLNYLKFQRLTIINRRPVIGPEGMRYFNFRDGDIYMKGSWILHTLRSTIDNDSLFFDILKSFYQQNAKKEITSQVLIDLVNAKTGKDYNWFFQHYLHNRFVPELHYVIKDNMLYCKWNKTADDFVMAVRAKGLKSGDLLQPRADTIQQVEINPTQFRIEDENFLVKPVQLKRIGQLK